MRLAALALAPFAVAGPGAAQRGTLAIEVRPAR